MKEKNRSKTNSEHYTLKWKFCITLSIVYIIVYTAGFNLVFPEEDTGYTIAVVQRGNVPEADIEAAVQETITPTESIPSTEQLSPSEKNAALLASKWVHGSEAAEKAAAFLKENGIGEIAEIQTLQSERGATFAEQADYEDAVIYLLLIKDTDGSEFIVRMDANGTVASIQKHSEGDSAT